MENAQLKKLSERDTSLIKKSVESCALPLKLKMLPRVLGEWFAVDLQELRDREPLKDIKLRLERLSSLSAKSELLLKEIQSLNDLDRAQLAFGLLKTPEINSSNRKQGSSFEHAREKIEMSFRAVQEIRDCSGDSAKSLKASIKGVYGTRRPRNLLAYFIMQDLASIFEWLTECKATRRFDRVDGVETGPFRSFVASVWPLIFECADDELGSAMKNWSQNRKKYKEYSGFIANCDLRHREWKILPR